MPPSFADAVLSTPRLRLQPLGTQHIDAIASLAGAREVAETTLLIPHPYRREDAEAFVALAARDAATAPPPQLVWAISHTTQPVLGCISLSFNWPHSRAEMGYWIGVPFWGCGYATEAARAVIDWGFSAAGLNRIDAHHMAHNPASGRVLEKVGMTREGVVREHIRRDGRFIDGVVYSILRREWSPSA